jgi:predicted enzyme related to lactoylglutathione lyase
MTVMTGYSPGTFCWVDLTTTDAAGSKQFYSDLFGWTAEDVPVGEGAVYTMFAKDGKQTCAQYEMFDEMRDQGMPPHWKSYISVASADEAAGKAK